MAVSLADINVLIALAWPNHECHQAAHEWFAAHAADGWATCPMTQCGFVRLSSNPKMVPEAVVPNAAIDLLHANGARIDTILLDATIPGASSREVVSEVAKLRPDIGIILTSAYSREMLMSPLSAPQIRGFIRKPFQFAELVQALRGVLPA